MLKPPPDPKYLLRGDMGPVHSLLFNINSNVEQVFAGTAESKVYIWNLKNNREEHSFFINNDPCLSLNIVDNHDLITQQKNGIIKLWNTHGSDWVLNQSIDTNVCNFCRSQLFLKDVLLVSLENSNVGLLSLKTCEISSRLNSSLLPETVGEVMAIKPLDDQNQILVAYESGLIALWDVRRNDVVNWLKSDPSPMSIDFDCSCEQGIIGGPLDTLQIFNLPNEQVLSIKSTLKLKNPGTSVIKIRPDGKIFCTGSWDGQLRLFSMKKLRQLATLDQHKECIYDIIYSSKPIRSYDSNLMASAGKDGYISLWDIYN